MLPPLQVVAAAINFCTMLLNSNHLFSLPFKSISSIASSRVMLKNIDNRRPPAVEVQQKTGEYENVEV
jgi:hypothetical protein